MLYFALAKKKYNYSKECQKEMGNFVSTRIGCDVPPTRNEHEWDALISVYAVLCGDLGKWTNDLHAVDADANEELITPCGSTNYWWP